MANSPRQSIMALLASLAVFFGSWALLKWPILLGAGLAVGTYVGTFLISKPKLKIGHIRVDALPDGNELKRLLLEAKDDMDAIDQASKQITNLPIRQQSEQLYQTGLRILEYLEKNPDRIPAARRFMGYYLNTARDILEKYLPFQSSGLRTEEVKRVTQATERAMPILNQAFENQFTNLMQNDIIDIESDIKVLEMTLQAEGGNYGSKQDE